MWAMDLMAGVDMPTLAATTTEPHGYGKLLLGLAMFAVFASYELWAVQTRHLTLSQQFARSGQAVKWAVGGGLGLTVLQSVRSRQPRWLQWTIAGVAAFTVYHLYIGMAR
jgi:hypothetical protein